MDGRTDEWTGGGDAARHTSRRAQHFARSPSSGGPAPLSSPRGFAPSKGVPASRAKLGSRERALSSGRG